MTTRLVYDTLIAETGEYRRWYFRSDADAYAERMTFDGFHVLRGTDWIYE